MRSTFRLSYALTALLAMTSPAAAQQPADGPAAPAGRRLRPRRPLRSTDAAEADGSRGGGRGRRVVVEEGTADHDPVPAARRTSAASTCSRRRRIPGVEFTGFKLDFGAAFTSQVQNLSHRNTAAPNMVSGVNANQLADIGLGFNNSTANVNLHAQLAPGIRVALTSYLSSRHHNETWVKDGYIQIDQSPIDFVAAEGAHGDRDRARRPHGDQLRRRALPPQRQRQRDLQPVRRQLHHGRLHDRNRRRGLPQGGERHRDGVGHRRRDPRHGARRPASAARPSSASSASIGR